MPWRMRECISLCTRSVFTITAQEYLRTGGVEVLVRPVEVQLPEKCSGRHNTSSFWSVSHLKQGVRNLSGFLSLFHGGCR